jgi:flagellar biogenesis protein FliO
MQKRVASDSSRSAVGGLAGWLLSWFPGRLRRGQRRAPRLAVIERITLGPRQALVLVEAEGRRLLLATSPEGTPAFYSLDEPGGQLASAPISRASTVPIRQTATDRDVRAS